MWRRRWITTAISGTSSSACSRITQETAVVPTWAATISAGIAGNSRIAVSVPSVPAWPVELSSQPIVTWTGTTAAQIPSTASGPIIGSQLSPKTPSVKGRAAPLRTPPITQASSATSRSAER